MAPAQMNMMEELIPPGVNINLTISEPDITTLDYAQTGPGFTTTIGSSDIGVQYYYGRLAQPAMKINNFELKQPEENNFSVKIFPDYVYNPYHQIGLDYAQVLFGFNIRAEVAANITFDFDIESGLPVTAIRITTTLSKKFLRDELELRTSVVWGIEDKNCAIIPVLIWTKDDFKTALSGAFFAGDSKGQLGQYKDNNFLKISVTYTF